MLPPEFRDGRSPAAGTLVFLAIMLIAVRGLVGWLVIPGLMVVIGFVALKVPQPYQMLVTAGHICVGVVPAHRAGGA